MDILTLLVILIGVSTLLWIIVSCTEIEKLKTTVYGDSNKNEVSQTTEEVTTLFSGLGDAFKNIGHAFEVVFAGKIPKLEEDTIYYLCHPFTSGGRSMAENIDLEDDLYHRIIQENPRAKIIRPLKIIPDNMPHEEAMGKCFRLMDIADEIILPLGWYHSNGCNQEYERAKKGAMGIIFLSTN